jgi:hypothetical protein
MGRKIPSFRIALAMEKEEWKPFHNALDKSDRKKFDEMFDIPRLYISACSNSVQLVLLEPIIMSILFHHYRELKECIPEVEQIKARVNGKKEGLMRKEESKPVSQEGSNKTEEKSSTSEKEEATTLDSYFNKALTANNNTV